MKCIQFSYVFVLLEVRSIKFIAVYLLILSIASKWIPSMGKVAKMKRNASKAAAGVQTVDF